ncbi:MAG: ABC transporter permease, partial [Anaerovoracaceae bacterium]
MHNVSNKKAIAKLAKKSYKANKLRNTFAIVSIILTTLMFATLFTVALNLINSYEQETMRQVGSSYHGGFKYMTKEQYEKIKTHPLIKDIGYSIVLGFGENKELAAKQTEIRSAKDDLSAKAMFSFPSTGRMPTAEKEIAADSITLDLLGVPAKLGQKVPLSYSINGKKQTDIFTLVGYWKGDPIMTASQIWLSPQYVENAVAKINPKTNMRKLGTYQVAINFKSQRNIEEKLDTILVDSGYRPDEIEKAVNWAYLSNKTYDIGTILGAVSALLLIIFCGYLIISNIFLISVTRDIRFYGLLKTIGTTSKQLKRLIRWQAMALCAFGIPLGLILGYVIGVWLTPTV